MSNTPAEIIALIDHECAVAYREGYRANAHAIITALAAAGYKIMPREPTEEMAHTKVMKSCFRSMWDAAP